MARIKVYIIASPWREELALLFQGLSQHYDLTAHPEEADLVVVDLEHLPRECPFGKRV